MKTSKVILMSFLAVIVVFLLSFMITIENINHNSNLNKFEASEVDLSGIRTLKVHKGTHVNLSTATMSNLEFSYDKKLEESRLFEIINDTLILKTAAASEKLLRYKLNLKHVKAIINEGGSININLQQDSINIINNHNGTLQIHRNSSLKFIELKAQEKSTAIVSSKEIDELNAHVNNAVLIVNKPINMVKLTAVNRADVTLQNVNSLAAHSDSTSRYKVY